MTKRTQLLAATAAVFSAMALGTVSPTAAQQRMSPASPGDAALASRFADIARDALRGQTINEPSWRASSAMLQAANRLNPSELRYARLWVEAELRARDTDGAVEAVKAQLKAAPNNVAAQLQLVDLYLSRMESADSKLAYLRDLVGKPPVGEMVRAHAAARAARVLLDRSEAEQARAMLGQALRLNPLNVEALRLRYQMAAAGGTTLEQVTAMLALLRANPAQPGVMAALARQLADVGLPEASLQWYFGAATVGPRAGWPAPQGFASGYISELFIANQVEPAQKLTEQVLAGDPANVDVWFLKLVMDKATSPDALAASRAKAAVALTNRLAQVRSAAGRPGATTRPVDSGAGLELPDLAGDLADLKARTSNEAQGAYVSALSDIAWYQVYFLEQPVAAPVMEFLRQTLPADSVLLARLEGWNALVQGRGDEARVKLSAVADRDPLAKLGIIRLAGKDAAAQDATNADARKLINDNPSGVLGAMLWGALKGENAVQRVRSSQADAIAEELARFPADLLKVLDNPQEFYAVRGQPRQIAHSFGEPMLVEVTIQNLSDFDLTVGPDGVIRPDLWFDARLRGAMDQAVPGVAYETIADQGVLRARQGITQVVRVDQGELGRFLSSNPSAAVQVYAGVTTNPVPTRDGGLAPGPAGYRVQFPRVMERQAAPINAEPQRQRFYATLSSGTGADKIRTLELLATYVHLIRANKEAPREALAVADEMANAVRSALGDASPGVQAWAAYLSAVLSPPERVTDAIKQMLNDKAWEKRLLGLAATAVLTPEQWAQLPAKPGSEDADPVVRAYAQAVAELRAIAATQPAQQQQQQPGPASTTPAPPASAQGAAPAPAGGSK